MVTEAKYIAFPCAGCNNGDNREGLYLVERIVGDETDRSQIVTYGTEKELRRYIRSGWLEVSESSTSCPQCAADGLAEGDLDKFVGIYPHGIARVNEEVIVDWGYQVSAYKRYLNRKIK